MTGAVEQAQVVVQLLQPHLVEPLHTLQARWSLYSKEGNRLCTLALLNADRKGEVHWASL